MTNPALRAVVTLRVVPNARRTGIVGEYGAAIKIKVQAPALEGKANEALRSFLAGQLGLPDGQVEIVSGLKSRDKTVAIIGLSTDEVRARLLPT
jgi:uncharacterized protein (TIGR00251 family)